MPPRVSRRSTPKPEPALARGVRLTSAEKRLLAYPPTEGTWLCRAKHGAGESWTCGMANSANEPACVLCAAWKPRRPVLLWPAYLAACKKAGITPKQKAEDA